MRDKYNIVTASGYGSVKVAILKELVGLSKEKGYAYCSVATLASGCGMGKRSMQYHLTQLREDGVLNIEYGGGTQVSHYTINFEVLMGRGETHATSCTSAESCTPPMQEMVETHATFCTPPMQVSAPNTRLYKKDTKTHTTQVEGGVDKAMSKSKNKSTVIKIWNEWNTAMLLIGRTGTSIPQQIQDMVDYGTVPDVITNPIFNSINAWVDANPDWESRWATALAEIPINAFFDGALLNGKMWQPDLAWMFVPKGQWRNKQFIPSGDALGIEKVLADNYVWRRKNTAVNNKDTAWNKSAEEFHKPTGFCGESI
jgi:hypothetical protein